jgi:hypothetical protein
MNSEQVTEKNRILNMAQAALEIDEKERQRQLFNIQNKVRQANKPVKNDQELANEILSNNFDESLK